MGLADACTANGASTMAKSSALKIELRAFMVRSFEYNQQQIDSAIKYGGRVTYVIRKAPTPYLSWSGLWSGFWSGLWSGLSLGFRPGPLAVASIAGEV